jgi:hypothetical protein
LQAKIGKVQGLKKDKGKPLTTEFLGLWEGERGKRRVNPLQLDKIPGCII